MKKHTDKKYVENMINELDKLLVYRAITKLKDQDQKINEINAKINYFYFGVVQK